MRQGCRHYGQQPFRRRTVLLGAIRYLNNLIGDGTAYSPGEYNRNHKPDASRCYSKHYPVPDFGTVTGVTLAWHHSEGTTTTYYYDRER